MGNFLVYKSSAGSGKTYTLMSEYLSLALKYPNAYRHILAITFTNKAANEIKQRILANLKKLASFSNNAIPEKDKQLVERLCENTALEPAKLFENAEQVLTAILHNYSDFAVSTIDSFMHRVIRSFAFDLRLSMNFDVELDTDTLLNAAVDELISKVGKDEELTDLLRDYVILKAENDENWDISTDLKKSARALFKEKMTGIIPALEGKRFTAGDYDRICRKIAALKKENIEEGKKAVNLITQQGIDLCDFYQGSRGIGNFFSKVAAGKDANPFSSIIRNAVEEGKWFKAGSPCFNNLQPIEQDLISAVQRITAISNELRFLGVIRNNFHSTLLLKKINDELSAIREQRNLIAINDFNSIIAGVVKEQPVPFIYLRVGEKFRHFMIDEFQDTSGMQWENFLPLLENALSDSRLSMIVGDGKQAIYRFKNGDAEQFIDLPVIRNSNSDGYISLRQQLFLREYTENHLLTNYRSRKEIVDFNNAFFEFAVERFVPEYRKFYTDVRQKCREDNTGGLVKFESLPYDNIPGRIVKLVEEVKNDGYQYGDIAILCRVNKDAVQIAETLQSEGITVVSSESLLLSSSPEVNFLMNWVAYIQDPEDKVPVIAIIEYLFNNYPGLAEEFKPRRTDTAYLYDILRYLKTDINRHDLEKLPFYDMVELLVRQFRLSVINPLYIRFFLDRVLDFTRKDSSGAAGFLEYWTENAHKLSVSISRKKDAVQILTIHKSKGLDFPVVIYAYPDPLSSKSDLSWQNVSTDLYNADGEIEKFGMPLVYNYSAELEHTPLEDEWRIENEKIKLDKFNLYYVAFTRASERLYVLMPETSKIEDPPKRLSDLVGMFLQTANSGNQFGSGSRVQGHYLNAIDGEDEMTDSHNTLDISFEPAEWRDRIILAKRSPEEWPDLVTFTDQFKPLRFGKTDYGKLIHKILSKLDNTDDLSEVVTETMALNGIDDQELRNEVIQSIGSLMAMPQFNRIFSGKSTFSEMEILTSSGESYRPDRVVLFDDKTIVIDFKTGMPDEKYFRQVKQYVSLINEMGYPSPEGYIVYIGKEPSVIMVPACEAGVNTPG